MLLNQWLTWSHLFLSPPLPPQGSDGPRRPGWTPGPPSKYTLSFLVPSSPIRPPFSSTHGSGVPSAELGPGETGVRLLSPKDGSNTTAFFSGSRPWGGGSSVLRSRRPLSTEPQARKERASASGGPGCICCALQFLRLPSCAARWRLRRLEQGLLWDSVRGAGPGCTRGQHLGRR